MDFYEVLEKRRTIRDFSNRKVSDEVLDKILSAAFKAPTNDHLRQFEFIVVRGHENISRIVSPVAEYSGDRARSCSRCNGQRRTRYVRQCPAQTATDAYRKRLPRPAVFPANECPSVPSGGSEFAELFRFRMGSS